MSDKTISERLQPSLLDRLTDDQSAQNTERRDDRVIDLRRLREIIQRDLVWLLNTSDNNKMIDPERFPNAAKSVLNYGIEDVSGDYSTAQRAVIIQKSMTQAIQTHEPRIHPGSIDVKLRVDQDAIKSIVSFDIRADMWAQPLPIELYLRSQVDVTTGELKIQRMG